MALKMAGQWVDGMGDPGVGSRVEPMDCELAEDWAEKTVVPWAA